MWYNSTENYTLEENIMFKRAIALMLALVLAFAFTACGGDKEDTDVKAPTSDNEENGDYSTQGDIKVDLSDATLDIPEDAYYEDYTFTIFAPYPGGPGRFVKEATNGDPVNDAIYNRNLAIQDTLGVTIASIDLNTYTDKQAQKIIDSVLAGDHAFDAAAIHSTSACAALIVADAVLSFDYLEYCDLSKPWWVQSFGENCSMFDQTYFGINSSCWAYYNYAACLLFNKDLAKEHELPDLYELVRKGEWTVDKMIQVTKNFSEDLNNDGIFDINDRLAITSDDHAYLNYWYGAFRQSTVEKGENDAPTYLVNTPRMTSVIEKLNTLFNTGRRGIIYSMNGEREEYLNAFAEGRVLFHVGAATNATSLREYDINFGIIPLPKFDENQENYGSWVDPWHLTLCVPSDNPDHERTSIILEALGYYSYRMIYPALIEQQLFGSGTRDVESLEMLEDYIFPNVFFDFGYIYDGWGVGYSSLIRMLIPFHSTDIASFVAAKKNEAEAHYEQLYEAAMDHAN